MLSKAESSLPGARGMSDFFRLQTMIRFQIIKNRLNGSASGKLFPIKLPNCSIWHGLDLLCFFLCPTMLSGTGLAPASEKLFSRCGCRSDVINIHLPGQSDEDAAGLVIKSGISGTNITLFNRADAAHITRTIAGNVCYILS